MQPAKNKRKIRGEPSELQKLLGHARRSMRFAFLFSFLMNVLMLLLPLYSLQVLDRVMSSQSLQTLFALSVLTVVGFLFFGIFSAIRTAIFNSINQWLDLRLAPRLLSLSVVKSSMGFPVNASQLQRDLQNIKAFVANGVGVLMDVPWSLLFVLVVYMINPVLGFITLASAVIILCFALISEYSTRKPIELGQEISIRGMSHADTAARNAEAVEAMGMMPNILKSWDRIMRGAYEQHFIANQRNNIIQSASRVFRMLAQVVVIGVGGILALQNQLSVGGMIACSILGARALAPFEAAINVWKMMIAGRDSYNRLEEALSQSPNIRGTMKLPAPRGLLTVENAYFQPMNSKPIIKGVNFGLQPGQSLGIVGPSAAGKSTLAKMIVGLLPPSHGTVRLDGMETFKWNREDLGQYLGYMPQHVDLFPGTIRDNIARMEPDPSDEAVIEAAMMAGAHEMILRLPGGYETEYTVGNLSLSPGQRQRIGLARALYKKPRFLVLDEPNANLDGEGESALVGALQRIKQMGITYIVVAHRPSIVSNVDLILILQDGLIKHFGPRQEILSRISKSITTEGGTPRLQSSAAAPAQGAS